MRVLGIDIGGTGIKAAPVDVTTGELLAERKIMDTPRPATPEAMSLVVTELASAFDWPGPTGVTFPGVVINGTVRTAANVDKSWIGTNAAELFSQALGGPATVLNDADAAGVAEMTFGAGAGARGTVLMLTFGTGIGSALFVDGASGAEHRVRPRRDPWQGRRAARLGARPGIARPVVVEMGGPGG